MRYRYERSKRTAAVSIISFLLIGFSTCTARAQDAQTYAPFPAPAAGQVTDLASVLSADSRSAINTSLNSHERSTGVEIRVVTINAMADFPGTPNGSIEAFATGLFNRWRIGNLPKNDGVLLLVSVKDRKARIEVGGGYGRAKDAAAQRIMSNLIVPRLRVNDFAAGVREGVDALVKEFNGRAVAQSSPRPAPPIVNNYSPMPTNFPRSVSPSRQAPFFPESMVPTIILIVFVLTILAVIARYALNEIAGGGQSPRRSWDSRSDGFFLGGMMDSNSSSFDSSSSSSSFGGSSDSSSSSCDSGGGSSDGGGASGDF